MPINKSKLFSEIEQLKQQLRERERERERESRIVNRCLLVVNTILTSANL